MHFLIFKFVTPNSNYEQLKIGLKMAFGMYVKIDPSKHIIWKAHQKYCIN